jgi:hypothetical protein
LEAYGFNTPELELTLAQGTNQLVTLQFGKSPTNDSTLVYARRAGLPAVVTVERQALELWRAAQLNDFRDPHLVTVTRPIAGIEVTGTAPRGAKRSTSSPAYRRALVSSLPTASGLKKGFNTRRQAV